MADLTRSKRFGGELRVVVVQYFAGRGGELIKVCIIGENRSNIFRFGEELKGNKKNIDLD